MHLNKIPAVLYLNAWDGEDYGVQQIYDGLCDLVGWRNVIDWPQNPYLHKSPFIERQYDADLHWPTHHFQEYEIRDLLAARQFDLIVISSTRMVALGAVHQLRHWFSDTPIILLDMEDSENLNAGVGVVDPEVAESVIALFKREWKPKHYDVQVPVLPLPFSYPRSRATGLMKPAAGPLVFYRANDWGWKEDSPRHRMVRALKEKFGDQADVGLSSCTNKVWTNRLSVSEYHNRLWASRIGVAVNADGGSDNNRYWETVANGCVLVSDKPRHEIPNNFEHGTEAFFYETIEEACEIIDMLSRDHGGLRQRVAAAGFAKFMQYHTTAARAAYMLEQTLAQMAAMGRKPGWVA